MRSKMRIVSGLNGIRPAIGQYLPQFISLRDNFASNSIISQRIVLDLAKPIASPLSQSLLSSISILIATNLIAILTAYLPKKDWPSIRRVDPSLVQFSLGLLSIVLFPRLRLAVDTVDDLAWKIFLPASLILSISSISGDPKQGVENEKGLKSKPHPLPMFAAFLFGSLGSFLGGFLDCALTLYSSKSNVAEGLVNSAALTSSYIGGTVNFFETGNALLASYVKQIKSPGLAEITSTRLSKSFKLMAVVDIAVMIVYFAVLNHMSEGTEKSITSSEQSDVRLTSPIDKTSGEKKLTPNPRSIWLVTGFMGLSIACVRNLVQSKVLKLPGISTLSAVLSASVLQICLHNLLSPAILQKFQFTARKLSGHFLAVFYVSLGMLISPADLLSTPTSLLKIFPILLSTHLMFLSVARVAWNRIMKAMNRHGWVIDMDTMLIASNACVGGAATAASMASSIGRSDLTLLASLVGIVGYVIGTPLGLLLYKLVN